MRIIVVFAACLLGGVAVATCQGRDPLAGRTICIDPGHRGTAETDSYRVGPTGEQERLRNPEHNRREAEAYAAALTDFFSHPVPPITEKG